MEEIRNRLAEILAERVRGWGTHMEIENLVNQAYWAGKLDGIKEAKEEIKGIFR